VTAAAPQLDALRACDACLRRTWLLGRLAGHLDRHRDRLDALLALDDEPLIAAVGGALADELGSERAAFDVRAARRAAAQAGVETVCRCSDAYPGPLRELTAPPAVLHVIGGVERLDGLIAGQTVGIVGARRASPYGLQVAAELGRGMGAAGVPVVSGMAHGIDSAAHRGVLDAGGATIAVLGAGAERAYPASARLLHRRIPEAGAVVSELPPGVEVRRWMFPARNRIIAALSAMTIVVQARPGSGALLTARRASELGRRAGAVPGPVSSRLSAGPHELLRSGAQLVEGVQDVLDGLFGAGERSVGGGGRGAPPAELGPLLEAVADGHEPATAFALAGLDIDAGLAGLASLELGGWLRRGPGGRLSVAR
jgi:DNA processing protein